MKAILRHFQAESFYCSVSDSAYSYTFLSSVVCLSVVCCIRVSCLNRSTNYMPFGKLGSTLVRSNDALCQMWYANQVTLQGRGDFNTYSNPQLKLALLFVCYQPGSNTNQRLCVLPNYFCLVDSSIREFEALVEKCAFCRRGVVRSFVEIDFSGEGVAVSDSCKTYCSLVGMMSIHVRYGEQEEKCTLQSR